MAKLVILSEGLTGRSHELTVDKTTVGRVEDNTFAITDPSVSSHHCEVLLRGSDVVIRDLNSTNGTFIGKTNVTVPIVLISDEQFKCGNSLFTVEMTAMDDNVASVL